MPKYQATSGLKTRAFEYAAENGWTLIELSRRSGLSYWMLQALKSGARGIGPKTISGLRKAFPRYSFESLFYEEPAPRRRAS